MSAAAEKLVRRVLAGRAFASRGPGDRLSVHRARDRRTLFLGELDEAVFAAELSDGRLFWREDWLERRCAPVREAAPARRAHLPAVPVARPPRRRRTGLERAVALAPDHSAARAWTQAAAQLLADLEAGNGSGVRTMAWGEEMRVRGKDAGAARSIAPTGSLSRHRLTALKSRFDGTEWADLTEMIVRDAAISPLATRRGLSRGAMEKRLADLLARLSEAYALSLPADAA